MTLIAFLLGALVAIVSGAVALYWWLRDYKPMGY